MMLRHKLNEIDARWGPLIQLTLGIAVVSISIVLVLLALDIKSTGDQTEQLAQDNRTRSVQAAAQAREACIRTRAFAPTLADFYQREQILTPAQLAAYRATIPRSC